MNTGLGYLGSIPNGWKLVHLGRLTSEVKSLNSDCLETNALQFKMGNIISKSTGDSKYHPETLEGYTIVAPGDLVVNGLNLNYDLKSLRVGQVCENGVITSAYIIIRPKKIDADYFKYLLKGFDSIKTFHGMGKGIRLTLGYEELRRMYVPVPSPSEQSRIAAFLDERCGKIDEAIAKHKALIEKLDEYRKAVITKAVTKGVRGEREMKNSNIPWLGSFPSDWEIVKNKDVFSCKKIIVGEKESTTQLLSLTTKGVKTKSKDVVEGKVPQAYDGYQLVNPEQIVMCLFDLDCSAVFAGKSNHVGMVSPAYRVLSCKAGFLPDFADYWFSFVFDKRKYLFYARNLRFTLNYDEFATIPFPCPSPDEQSEIVDFLDKKCAAIDSAKERHQQLIIKLEEYKKSLIYNAVTGKIEC